MGGKKTGRDHIFDIAAGYIPPEKNNA